MIIDITNQPLHKTLRQLRIETGRSVAEVAERLGYRESTVYAWESGRNSPNYATMLEILNVYDVTVTAQIDTLKFRPRYHPSCAGMTPIAHRLRVERRSLGLSTYSAAMRAGISAELVRSWEGGVFWPKTQIGIDTLVMYINRGLNMSVSDILKYVEVGE